MRLLHYSAEKIGSLDDRNYNLLHTFRIKPVGLWVSVVGDCDWKWWCEAENFNLGRLLYAHEVMLKDDANILYLKTAEEVLAFHKKFPYATVRFCDETYEIDWLKVKKEYQGIIIPEYHWKCRLDYMCSWYYGWDCASGCIWDLSCIKEFKVVE